MLKGLWIAPLLPKTSSRGILTKTQSEGKGAVLWQGLADEGGNKEVFALTGEGRRRKNGE
jgi:hypothetical protein